MGLVEDRQDKTKELAVAVASKIFHYKWIAQSVGISEKTLIEWRKNDPEFESQLDQARAEFIKSNMRKARPDFLLESADRETFGRKEELTIKLDPAKELLKKYNLIDGDGNIIDDKVTDVRKTDQP